MMKKYFQKITLFTLLAFLSFTVFIIVAISRQPEEIKTGLLYHLALTFIILVAADVILKQILKLKTTWLWILQIFLLLVAIYIWIISE